MLAGSELILGVTGSIAAYKAAYLLRELRRAGALVTVVTTAHAERFVGALTWRTLSGRPVLSDLFDPRSEEAVEHVALAERAHAVIVAPATANILAKAAHGLADDFLSTLLLAARGPVLMVPAMDGGMWSHPATSANVATLRARGVTVLDPDSGELASGLAGKGRLPEVDSILEAVERLLTPVRDLAGERILVTAGPTREPIDPVRYLSNRSSGKMGHALATAALRRGAEVVLISGPTSLTPPSGAVYVPVQTAEEMREAALQHIESATIVIKAAAVADYRVRDPHARKIKSSKAEGLTLELLPTPDILKELAARRGRAFIVGFAAETHDVRASGTEKLRSKGIDLLVANDVSRQGIGFESDDNEVLLLDRWGGAIELPRMRKLAVAGAILDRALALRAAAAASPDHAAPHPRPLP
ncbi:MAG: bifunctional phosphopantothenoylcysteine decarboxylase/phosphopantothenate--cysteine ligase CoaBC [Candidatus Rokubacteria bacterium]|nr:bifunctional phosphopantothenoylcysteine decarboxylase/phosphopantothenate--cysteine ligase CoaBC [Candidatus Rokubacteria bacterium]MBI3104723.1 bifunctional phosphopantothenoylcysteine decarboxylase/phosphopantothenate--cysteine ligase CoaBC [Candidatus Rokubacteria bacterium]